MGYNRECCVQVLLDGSWSNFCLCRGLREGLSVAFSELVGHPFRVLVRDDGAWRECLVSGSMLSVEDKDFRMISA